MTSKSVASIFKKGGGRGGGRGFQITKSYLVSDKYRNEVALKLDTVRDQGVRGEGSEPLDPPWLRPCK